MCSHSFYLFINDQKEWRLYIRDTFLQILVVLHTYITVIVTYTQAVVGIKRRRGSFFNLSMRRVHFVKYVIVSLISNLELGETH